MKVKIAIDSIKVTATGPSALPLRKECTRCGHVRPGVLRACPKCGNTVSIGTAKVLST